jgi:hypothetical protein
MMVLHIVGDSHKVMAALTFMLASNIVVVEISLQFHRYMLVGSRYKEGQWFGPHDDKSVHLDEGCSTEYTLLVYLSGGVGEATVSPWVGRETVFYSSRKQLVAQVTTTKFHFYVLHDGIEKIPAKL